VTLLLTKQEKRVLLLMCQAKQNKEIAALMERKPKTISKHREVIYWRLGIDNPIDALRCAFQMGILTYEDFMNFPAARQVKHKKPPHKYGRAKSFMRVPWHTSFK